ncbi:MAG: universal stress protein [Acetobacteraceae bacterium]|nr:universal stress protein [Acetobacteraceae bacterium]
MALKNLLVMVDGSRRALKRLQLATDLAERHGASLTGLYVPDVFYAHTEAGRLFTEPESSDMRDDLRDESRRLEQLFWDQTKRAGLQAEWRVAAGPAAGAAAVHARFADLVILGHVDPDDPATQVAKGSVEQVLFSAGRPVLVIPYTRPFDTVGESVIIGWKTSREAARAVNDAIPILKTARSVTVLAVNAEPGFRAGEPAAAEVARHLGRHGINTAVVHRTVAPALEPDALLDYAAEMRADLLVVGGYGRLTQSIMGGVTRVLLERMRLPVLLSH